jgi:hypothetical protein
MEIPLKGTYTGIPSPFYCVDSRGRATTTSDYSLAAGTTQCR